MHARLRSVRKIQGPLWVNDTPGADALAVLEAPRL